LEKQWGVLGIIILLMPISLLAKMNKSTLILSNRSRKYFDVVLSTPIYTRILSDVLSPIEELRSQLKKGESIVTIDHYVTDSYEDALDYLSRNNPGMVVAKFEYENGEDNHPNGFELLRRMSKAGNRTPTFVCIGPYKPNRPAWNNIITNAQTAYAWDMFPDEFLDVLEGLTHSRVKMLGDGANGEARVRGFFPMYHLKSEPTPTPIVVKEYKKIKGKFNPIDVAEVRARDNLHFRNDPNFRVNELYAYFFPTPDSLIIIEFYLLLKLFYFI